MKTTTMSEAALEARRAYKKAWNERNKDRVREAQRRYWERKAAAAAEEEKHNAVNDG